MRGEKSNLGAFVKRVLDLRGKISIKIVFFFNFLFFKLYFFLCVLGDGNGGKGREDAGVVAFDSLQSYWVAVFS